MAASTVTEVTRLRTAPWPTRRLFGEEEKQAVMRLFDRAQAAGSDVMGYNGPAEEAYCKAFADFLGGGYADGVDSGTNAVYVALRALDIPPGSEVIVPPVTEPGGTMPVVLCNLVPVAADTAPASHNTSAGQIAARLTKKTKAIIVAHIAGIPIDMEPVCELARSKDIPIIEDCAQAHGATCRGKLAGTWGDVAAFSTMFGKHHASGGQGGVVYTRKEEFYWRVRRCADRGKPFGLTATNGNVVAALNCNMDELHATIGLVQLAKLPANLAHRRAVAKVIENECRTRLKHIHFTADPEWGTNAYWFLLFRIDPQKFKVDRNALVEQANAAGGAFAPGYNHVPLRMQWFKSKTKIHLPNFDKTATCYIHNSFHEGYSAEDAKDLVSILEKVEKANLK